MNALEKADQLKYELDKFRPLNSEAEARIMQKFRLDWNYHSNNIEGNSLTYGETKAFILFGITAGKKPFKDYLEIKGHNEAINWVVDLVKGNAELTQVFIRELHTLLLKESSESFAQTPDGKPTKKRIEVGKYKTLPNHVLTATGEMFYFASPEETPAMMQELIDWYRTEREKLDVNPIILATLFHYRFIRIHPFDDGNGRTARILMNFILMQNGYPPVIIKTEDKENYYGVLHLADVGELEPFIEYIAENLVRSLEIMIKGAKGESIEEPDDLDKELALLERRLSKDSKNSESIKNDEAMEFILKNSILPLAEELLRVCHKFDKFYSDANFRIYLIYLRSTSPAIISGENIFTDLEKYFQKHLTKIIISYLHEGLNKNDVFDFKSEISIHLGKTSYTFTRSDDKIIYEKRYSENLNSKEIEAIVKIIAEEHKKYLEEKILELKL